MKSIFEFMEHYLDLPLLCLIIAGGVFVTKYTKPYRGIKNAYKVLIMSVVLSLIFLLFEECKKECAIKYLFTYLFATSFYELIVKEVMRRLKINN